MAHPAHPQQGGRTIAPIPNHRAHVQKVTPYTPDPRELYPGARNRLFLALRSSIPDEVDWALPRLVVASYDRPETFKLEAWVDSVGALKQWPAKWLDGLEKEAAVFELKAGRLDFEGRQKEVKRQKRDLALSAMPEWTNDPAVERRATNSLLVLRNASFAEVNAKSICRTSLLSFLEAFFSLPIPFLHHIMLKTPEPVHHILTIAQSIFPHIRPDIPGMKRIFAQVFPELLVETRDSTMMSNLLPLIVMGQTLQSCPAPPSALIPHLLQLLVLRTSGPLLDLTLDLLISLSLNAHNARRILSDPGFPYHLKSLTYLLEYNARFTSGSWDPPSAIRGKMVPNPAGVALRAEEMSRRRAMEREWSQKNLEPFGGMGVFVDVGDKTPVFCEATKKKLYAMREPARSIAWMHETFVYSSTAQVLQVTFWHAYRDFFSDAGLAEPSLSASEVIRNVSVAFPGASAKIWQDEMGAQKFVIGGVGFRKYSDEDERFLCLWKDCTRRQGSSNTAQLLEHIQTLHLKIPSTPQCQWARCTHSPCSSSHILTHLPLNEPEVEVPELVLSQPGATEPRLNLKTITSRPLPVPAGKLSFQGQLTPQDAKRRPAGASLLAALLIRNLARTLRSEISLAVPPPTEDISAPSAQARKAHLLSERYGLPIPDVVLKEEEEEQAEADHEKEDGMGEAERERAKLAFESVEERVVGVVEVNLSGIGHYLGDAFGW